MRGFIWLAPIWLSNWQFDSLTVYGFASVASFDVFSQLLRSLSLYKYWWPTTISEKCCCYVFVCLFIFHFTSSSWICTITCENKAFYNNVLRFWSVFFYGFLLVSFLYFLLFILLSFSNFSLNTTQICLRLTDNRQKSRTNYRKTKTIGWTTMKILQNREKKFSLSEVALSNCEWTALIQNL